MSWDRPRENAEAWYKSQPTRPAWSKARVRPTFFWHMWRTRQWPYMHVANGDRCFLVSDGGSDAEIFAEVVMDHIVRVKYYGRRERAYKYLVECLEEARMKPPSKRCSLAHPETVDRPDTGYLFAFVAYPLSPRPLGIPKPRSLQIRQQGWAKHPRP